jgi:hypothetical protein
LNLKTPGVREVVNILNGGTHPSLGVVKDHDGLAFVATKDLFHFKIKEALMLAYFVSRTEALAGGTYQGMLGANGTMNGKGSFRHQSLTKIAPQALACPVSIRALGTIMECHG